MNRPLLLSVSICGLLVACGPQASVPLDEQATSEEALTLNAPVTQLPSAPTIHSLSPNLGLAGTVVTINGVNFVNLRPASLASVYRFENDPTPLQVTVVSDTRARFTVPAQARGGRVCRSSVLSPTPTSCTSNPFVVGDPNARVRLDNRTPAEFIGARLNGVEVLAPQTVAGGSTRDVYPVTPGNYVYQVDVGFGPFAGPAANRIICTIDGNASFAGNATTPLWVADLTVPDLLGHCGVSTYVANYLDDQGLPRQLTLRFESTPARWSLLQGGVLLGSGPVDIVVWNPGSAFTTFRLRGAANWSDIVIGYPYATFVAGPPNARLAFGRVGSW